MKIDKKYLRVLFVCGFLTIISLNFAVITHTNFGNVSLKRIMNIAVLHAEYPDGPGQVGTTERCELDLGGGWFTSSVEYVCWDCYVCPLCTCTPHACGEVFYN